MDEIYLSDFFAFNTILYHLVHFISVEIYSEKSIYTRNLIVDTGA